MKGNTKLMVIFGMYDERIGVDQLPLLIEISFGLHDVRLTDL